MKKITSFEMLMAELRSDLGDCGYFGLRDASEEDLADIANPNVMYLNCSHEFDDDQPTDNMLPGTCAINVRGDMTIDQVKDSYRLVQDYCGTNVKILVYGKYMEYGHDHAEVILGNDNCTGAKAIAFVEI